MQWKAVVAGAGWVVTVCGLVAAAYYYGYRKGETLGAERGAAAHAARTGKVALWQAVAIRKGKSDRALSMSELQMWNAILPAHHLLGESDAGTQDHKDYWTVLGLVADYFAQYPEPPNRYGPEFVPHESHEQRKRLLEKHRGTVPSGRDIAPPSNTNSPAPVEKVGPTIDN